MRRALLVCVFAASTAMASEPSGDWTMPAGDYASTRYSALDSIDTGNVAKLALAFTFDTGIDKGQEAAPLVADGMMYIVTPFPNRVYALDLTRDGAPVKWEYEPKPDIASQGVACCDVVTRGGVLWQDELIFNTLDGNTIALDAKTGSERWKTQLANIHLGETITMAPLVASGKVLVGDAGGEMGVRGWLAALDARDGHIVWKAFHTGPDADVLIGPDFHPYYAGDRGTDLGVKTWPPEAWKIGGGTMWGWISYDPATNLIFYGTANPGPWNAAQRPGDNKWTSGMFARDADTGAARWYYQFSPHDLYDYDAVNENVLLDLGLDGAPARAVIVRPERNGFVYVMDRATGQVLSADKYGTVNTIKRIDLETGRPEYNDALKPRPGRVTRNICPGSPGVKDWNPSAYSPQTGLLYIPHINLCMDVVPSEVGYIAGMPYVGTDQKFYAGPGGNRGVMTAWDVLQRKAVWEVKEDLPLWSGALATAGGLVFYGTMDGHFRALDAKTGQKRWEFKTGSGIIGQPVAYRGPDGREYIAVLAGVGGWAGSVLIGKLDRRDKTAASGFVAVTKDLPEKTKPGGLLYVFALPK